MDEKIPAMQDVFFKVEGIHCSSCVDKISRALVASKLCDNFWIDRATNIVRIRRGHGGQKEADFIKEISAHLKATGYDSQVLADPHKSHKHEGMLQVLYPLVGVLVSYWFIPEDSVPFPRQCLLTLLGVLVLFFLSFKSFAKGAINSLKSGSSDVDVLVSIGASAACILSLALIVGQIPGHLFFVEAFAILLLVSLGHYVENYVLARADKSLRSMMALAPPKALRLGKNGNQEEIDVGQVLIGDIIILKPGDRIPVDGKIIEGRSDFDESLLTGESLPVAKGIGENVFGGTINLTGNLKFTVSKLGSEMLLTQIIDTVFKVRQSRADIQRIADKASNIFVPVVIAISVIAFILWYSVPDFMHGLSAPIGHLISIHVTHEQTPFWVAFSAALGVLVISCPCAMGLATPAALIAVSGMAAKRGILIRDGRAIEAADKIKHVFFDKTGTLSSATPKKINEWSSPDFDESLLLLVSSQSKHPMSRALSAGTLTSNATAEIQEFPGEGVKATVTKGSEKINILMGNYHLMQQSNIAGIDKAQDFILGELEFGRSLVYWAQNGKLAAIFSFEDELREGAVQLVEKFSTQAKVYILSGDHKKVLSSIAKKFNLKEEDVLGELSPLDKVQVLQSYQAKGDKVAFIGDGLNDAPVLQAADLGIAVSSASDLAKQSADIVLLTNKITYIYDAFQLAKKGMKTIRQNLFWAFAYNVIAIPLAFLGLIDPVLCTIFMAFSDLVIIFNSLRVFLSRKTL